MNKRLVVLLALVASVGYVCRVAVTIVAPHIMRDFHLSQTQMGTVFSAFLVGYTIFQVPSGILADRVSARRIFLTLCVGWTALTLLAALTAFRGIALVWVIPQLWLTRALFGVVAAPTYPTSGRTIALTTPLRLQARANSVVLASVGIGSAVAPLLLAPLADRFGWRLALAATASLSAAAGLLWWWLAPAGHRDSATIGDATSTAATVETNPSVIATDFALPLSSPHPLRKPSFWFLFGSYFLQGYLGYIFIFWFYLYLVQVRHFEVLKAASLTALPWIATLIGIPVGGVISDAAVARWGATWGRRSLPLAALAASAVFLVIGARTPSASLAVAALTVCTVLVLSTEGPFWATMAELAGARSGLAGGTMNFGSNLGGMISPTLTPWLAQRIGWEAALSLTAALAVVGSILWLGVRIESSSGQEALGGR
jgi:MFS transporter, ACS family, glucarate transporter